MSDSLTGFLYARPSFLEGMARIADVGNLLNEYNSSLSEEQADYLALKADWAMVGRDLSDAIAVVAKDVEAGSVTGRD
jgi:hypothetical protein